MTPEEAARRAVDCTATGALSGLPKWEWRDDGMLFSHGPPRPRATGGRDQQRNCYGNGKPPPAWVDTSTWLPDFTDDATVLLVLPLVRRAWTGYRVMLTWRESGNVDLLIFKPSIPNAIRILETRIVDAVRADQHARRVGGCASHRHRCGLPQTF